MSRSGQRGVALFTAIFLIVVIAAVATTVALITTTQQVTSGRSLDATRAYYVARARLDSEIADLATSASGATCPGTGSGSSEDIDGFTTRIESCNAVGVSEGGDEYDVFTLTVSAFRGDRGSGTLVRRELEAVVTNQD